MDLQALSPPLFDLSAYQQALDHVPVNSLTNTKNSVIGDDYSHFKPHTKALPSPRQKMRHSVIESWILRPNDSRPK
uniref:Uncharacterized protein n=1 Tax=Aeromonas salmonicida subsp. smithia TaxID=80745 RepID=A0A0S1GNA3_AERSA|nr:hypothetical protein [Aeromonas salmonicida subsp. smithia]